jgi:hypothetical protein
MIILKHSVRGEFLVLDPKRNDLDIISSEGERVVVALTSDEWCLAVKCQSNFLSAGFRRNICKYIVHLKSL